MKALPDNPDLDHLRQQAKDLLAGLRDIDPATSLATAQTSLARQYGFRTWTDLKAEVDRQRGRAEVADPAPAQAVADAFGLGAVTGPMRSMARPDDSGRQWSLETDRGRWAARTMDTWWPIVSDEDDTALQEAAAAAGVLLPAPVRGRAGNVTEPVGGHTWRVHEWAHSGPPLVAPTSSAVTREVGAILATLHGLALPVDRISPWHHHVLSDLTWPALVAEARAAGVGWAAELAELVPSMAQPCTDVPDEKPVLSHNALGPAQVRRGPGGRLVVFSWHHAGGQPPSWELGDALVHWTVDAGRGVNVAGARALVEGYRATAGSLPVLGMDMFRGAVTSLTNYAMGQVEYALAARDAEDRRYADRSVRHLLTHLRTPATLERLLDAVN